MNKTSDENTFNILIVDDETDICNMVRAFLTDEGYQCHCSCSAEEAWAIIRSRDVHCILLDVNLPGESGIEMLEPLRCEHPNIPVVMMTGRKDPDTAWEAVAGGANGYLTKPFTKRELLITVSHVLQSV